MLKGWFGTKPNDAKLNQALIDAIKDNDLGTVRKLVEQNSVNVEATDGEIKMTALMLASASGHLPVVRYLVERTRANVEAVDKKRWTALMWASYWGHLPVVQYLVEAGKANLNAVNKYGLTASDLTGVFGFRDVRKYLQQQSVPQVAPLSPLSLPLTVQADVGTIRNDAANNNIGDANKINVGITVTETAAELNQALILYAKQNKLDKVRLLVEQNKVDVDVVDEYGWTALMYASSYGHLTVVQFLQGTARANVEAVNVHGRTALMHASRNGHLTVVQFLVEKACVNVEAVDKEEKTALVHAMEGGRRDIVVYLRQQPVTPSAPPPPPMAMVGPASTLCNSTADVKMGFNQGNSSNTSALPIDVASIQSMGDVDAGVAPVTLTVNPFEFAQAIEMLQQQNEQLEAALQSFHPGEDPVQYLNTEQYNVLVGMIGSTCQTQDEEDEKQAILSSPEHCEFYLLLARKLYCMIHAFETLSSGVVQHNSGGGTSMRAFTTQLLQEKGVDAIKGTKIGVFLSGIVGWVKKNLSAVPFLDTAGSLCQLFLALKDERERYMSVARVADFATIVTITQSNGDGLRCTVERFARLMVRARIGMSHKPIVEQRDNDDFGRCKQFILKMLGESANTLSKEKASQAADCGFAHLMKPTVGTSLHTLLHQPSLQHLDSFDEALAAATLDTTVDEIRKLNKVVCTTQVSPMASKVVQQSSVAVAAVAAAAAVQPRAETTAAVAMTVASQDLDATEAMSRAQAEIERLGREMSFLKKQVKSAKPSDRLDAGGGLVYADSSEKYKDTVVDLTRQVADHKEQITVATEELSRSREEQQALRADQEVMRIKMEQMEKELQSKRGRR